MSNVRDFSRRCPPFRSLSAKHHVYQDTCGKVAPSFHDFELHRRRFWYYSIFCLRLPPSPSPRLLTGDLFWLVNLCLRTRLLSIYIWVMTHDISGTRSSCLSSLCQQSRRARQAIDFSTAIRMRPVFSRACATINSALQCIETGRWGGEPSSSCFNKSMRNWSWRSWHAWHDKSYGPCCSQGDVGQCGEIFRPARQRETWEQQDRAT